MRWHPDAVLDALAARDWHAERNPAAATAFLLALDDAVLAVTEASERWPLKPQGYREYVFPKPYPFKLVYVLQPTLQVVAVAVDPRTMPMFLK